MKNISPSTYKDGIAWIMQPFPKYIDNNENHKGIDLACGETDQMISVTDGIIKEVSINKSIADYVAILYQNLGLNYLFIYRHITTVKKKGDIINEGEPLGRPNLSGHCNGYHCHFECYLEDILIDPVYYLLTYQPDLRYVLSKKFGNLLSFYQKKDYYNMMITRIV